MQDLVCPRLADADLIHAVAVCHLNCDLQEWLDVVDYCVCVFHVLVERRLCR